MILKMMGKEVDTSLFKKRKGFRFIVIDGEPFQFNWSETIGLILYDINQKKYTISYEIWGTSDDSEEYKTTKTSGLHRTWHGKHKKDACFGGWGKAEVAEMFRKYQKQLDKQNKQ